MVGIYWANHHYIFRLYKRTTHAFNLLNLLFLMSISFLPFPTAILSRYLLIPGQETMAAMFYAFGLLLPAVTFFLMWAYAKSGYRLIDRRLSPEFVLHLTRQYGASVVVYSIALATSFYRYQVGLAICVGLTLLYLLPSKTPQYQNEMEQ